MFKSNKDTLSIGVIVNNNNVLILSKKKACASKTQIKFAAIN